MKTNRNLKLFMKQSHSFAKILCSNNDNTYRENLSIAMRVKYLSKGLGKSDIYDINFIKNNVPTDLVYMWSIKDYHKKSKYTIHVPAYFSFGRIEIKQYQVVDQSYMQSII